MAYTPPLGGEVIPLSMSDLQQLCLDLARRKASGYIYLRIILEHYASPVTIEEYAELLSEEISKRDYHGINKVLFT